MRKKNLGPPTTHSKCSPVYFEDHFSCIHEGVKESICIRRWRFNDPTSVIVKGVTRVSKWVSSHDAHTRARDTHLLEQVETQWVHIYIHIYPCMRVRERSRRRRRMTVVVAVEALRMTTVTAAVATRATEDEVSRIKVRRAPSIQREREAQLKWRNHIKKRSRNNWRGNKQSWEAACCG